MPTDSAPMLEEWQLSCPYCGEPISTLLDLSAGDQAYYEDCSVCCRPIHVHVQVGFDGSLHSFDAQRDDA